MERHRHRTCDSAVVASTANRHCCETRRSSLPSSNMLFLINMHAAYHEFRYSATECHRHRMQALIVLLAPAPSTMLRMVPLARRFAAREDSNPRPAALAESSHAKRYGVHTSAQPHERGESEVVFGRISGGCAPPSPRSGEGVGQSPTDGVWKVGMRRRGLLLSSRKPAGFEAAGHTPSGASRVARGDLSCVHPVEQSWGR